MQSFGEYAQRPTTYVDMDGVLVNFCKSAEKYIPDLREGQFTKISYEDWKQIRAAEPSFWLDMDMMPHGAELWRTVNKYCPSILTAYPNGWEEASVQKRAWVQRYLTKFGYCPRQQFHSFPLSSLRRPRRRWGTPGSP